MSEVLEYSYWEKKGVKAFSTDGMIFSSAIDTINHFGYPNLGHVQEGSLMCFGGYNSRENTKGIPGRINSSTVDQFGSENPELIELLEQGFEKQYPIFACRIGGIDLHETLWEGYKSYKVRRVLPVLVEFILKYESKEARLNQLYIIGSKVYGLTMTLVGSRSGLYSTFKQIFGYDFPREILYPIVQQDTETVAEWRRGRELPPLE